MKHLEQAITDKDWQRTETILNSMSNAEFRRAEAFIRNTVLPSMPNDELWEALFHLISYRRQAFISGLLAIEKAAREETLNAKCEGAHKLAEYLDKEHPDSFRKILNMTLPLLRTEEQIEEMLDVFGTQDETIRIAALLKVESPIAYYALFTRLRQIPERKKLASQCMRYIMKRENDMAYNMAAIMKAYFGLDDTEGRFSLRIEPYELSMLDSGREAFYNLLNGRRPQVKL